MTSLVLAYAVPVVLASVVGMSLRVTNPEDMGVLFERTQKLLAAEDYEGAREGYERLLAIPEQLLLRPSRALVQIDEEQVNLRDAARYQLANLERRQGKLLREEGRLGGPEGQDSLEALAREHILRAAEGFTVLRREEGFSLRDRAAYLVIDSYYEGERYADAAAACETLLVLFPEGEYRRKALYSLGWALHELRDYEGAADGFRRFLAGQLEGIRAERARLHLGMALEEAGHTEEALAAYEQLGDAYNPGAMSDEEKAEAALAGLREGHSRRSIAAKAWVKRGDMLRELGRYDDADEAYRTVIEGFGHEEHLVEMAWVRRALLAEARQDAEAAIAVYRLAGERSERAGFQARMQASMMSLMYEAEQYEEALAAHRLFLGHYAAHGEEAGVSVAEARFREAVCLRRLSAVVRADSAQRLLAESAAVFGKLTRECGDSYLVPDALLARGMAELTLGDTAAARGALEALVADYAGTDVGCHGRLQLARLEEATADSSLELILAECANPAVQAGVALHLGQRYRTQGRLERARKLLATVSEEHEGYGHAQLELAQIQVQEGDYEAALSGLTGLLQSGAAWMGEPRLRAQVQAQSGLIHQRLGEHEKALAYLDAACPSLGTELRGTVQFGRGWSLLELGQAGQAWEVWTAALGEQGTSRTQVRRLLRGLGMCARRLGDPGRVLPVYEGLLAVPERRVSGHLALAQHHLDEGRAKEGLRQVEALAGAGGARASLLAGKALYALDRLDEAEQVLREAVEAGVPQDVAAELAFTLGSVAVASGAYGEAIKEFGTARAMASRRSLQGEALYYEAQSVWAAGDEEVAQARLQALAEEYPEHGRAAEAAFAVGELLYAKREYRRAREAYRAVAERWPRRDQAPEALYGAGWCSLELGDEPAMTKAFEELATRFPDHRRAPQGLLHVADHLYNQGRLDEAGRWYGAIDERYDEGRPVREAQKLLRVLADMEADSLYAEAMALFDAGEMEGAIAALGRVVKEHPGTPSEAAARCNIGVAYQRLLDYRRAAEAYWDAVQALETREGEREALEFARNSLEWIQVEVFQEDSEEGV